MAKRAYGREDKAERRDVILMAAAKLFRAGRGDLPSVATIADGAGLAKGTVYLYFRTKEAIFAALLLRGWSEVVDLLEANFVDRTASGHDPVSAFLAAYVAHLDARPDLLRLDALRGTLERNLEPQTLTDFKQAFLARLTAGGERIEQALDLTPGRGVQLLLRTHALTVGLWQSMGAESSSESAASAAPFQHGFQTELAEALVEYWRGALLV
jgi:AcrR family transcriptional regulator